ncbi:MAG TPA: response regulator [Anaerolineales bacterium]
MSEPVVLIVDDEPNVVRLCQRLLERASFRVLAVTSPSQGLAILSREHVDLLLVDYRMPGLDGFQLLTLARRHQPELAAVIMTGFGTVETAITALQLGADSLILKPFVGAELIQTVQRALQENAHRRDLVRLRTLRPLFHITETLFTETDPERLNELIVDEVIQHLHCSYAGLYERQVQGGPVQKAAWRGEPEPGDLNCAIQAPLERILYLGAPLWVSRDGPGDDGLQSLMVECNLGSLIGVPVNQKNRSSALIAIRSIDQPIFREADLEMFSILARQAAIALENARLYAELRSYIWQVEQSRRAMDQAEKMAAAGRLTASIAHEINNPLQSLHNCMYLASHKELSPDEQQKYMDMAQKELERLMVTVQRMLDLYRPGARDRKLSDLNELVKHVLHLLEPQLANSSVTVHTRLASHLPSGMVVANQIQQVLINLIINSMEAMPQGGEIFIETARIHSANGKKPSAKTGDAAGVQIIIEDTGPGIPESERESIFEPFISTKENGTGLGLAVSYGIVLAHGGSLSLMEGRGKGACFRITLPEGRQNESKNSGR